MTDPLDLGELDRKLAAATKLPWTVETEMDGDEGYSIEIPEINRVFFDPDWADGDEWDASLANAAYIAAACNAVPALIARVRELEAQQ